MIRLRRIGQDQERRSQMMMASEEIEGDFERIFHDSGIEFAHLNGSLHKRENTDEAAGPLESPPDKRDLMRISQSEIQARIVLASARTSSCNMQTETDADIADCMSKVLTPAQISQNGPFYRDNFVKMLTKKQNKRDTIITYDQNPRNKDHR